MYININIVEFISSVHDDKKVNRISLVDLSTHNFSGSLFQFELEKGFNNFKLNITDILYTQQLIHSVKNKFNQYFDDMLDLDLRL